MTYLNFVLYQILYAKYERRDVAASYFQKNLTMYNIILLTLITTNRAQYLIIHKNHKKLTHFLLTHENVT